MFDTTEIIVKTLFKKNSLMLLFRLYLKVFKHHFEKYPISNYPKIKNNIIKF